MGKYYNRAVYFLRGKRVLYFIFLTQCLRSYLKTLLPIRFKLNPFVPPPARGQYIEARQQFDISNPAHAENLKKLLMGRAVQNIPIVLNLQNEGSSVERMYRKGMITEDLHERVRMPCVRITADL